MFWWSIHIDSPVGILLSSVICSIPWEALEQSAAFSFALIWTWRHKCTELNYFHYLWQILITSMAFVCALRDWTLFNEGFAWECVTHDFVAFSFWDFCVSKFRAPTFIIFSQKHSLKSSTRQYQMCDTMFSLIFLNEF